MFKNIISNSSEETHTIGIKIGKSSKSGDVYGLYGDLGTGKTILAKGIAAGLGITEDVTSPTFNLLEIYEGRKKLYHFDLYRIESSIELDQLFFEEYWENDGISVIEWAERAENRLPANTVKIRIEYINDNNRKIKIEYPAH